jgi:tRNA(Ile)-lysidine synthase TilS/MesJ
MDEINAQEIVNRDRLRQITDSLISETEPLTEKIVYETSKNLFDEKKLLMISDLSVDNINQIMKLLIIDMYFYRAYVKDRKNADKLKNVIDCFLKLTISKNRKSRGEIIEMFKRVEIKTQELEAKKRYGIF